MVPKQVAKEDSPALQAMTVFGAAATAFWRFRQYHIYHPDVSKENHHLEMVAIADQVRAMQTNEFRRAIFDA